MSLIGPRPLPIPDSCCCPDKFIARFAVKPGMTGLWQSRYQNTINSRKKFKLDDFYAKKYGLRLDLLIALKTVFIVLKGEK